MSGPWIAWWGGDILPLPYTHPPFGTGDGTPVAQYVLVITCENMRGGSHHDGSLCLFVQLLSFSTDSEPVSGIMRQNS